jgi:integrase
MRLTDISIRALAAPEKGEKIYYDDGLSGFGVRVSEGGTKSFVLQHGKLRRRETIGRVGILDLKTARQEARRRLAEYTLGRTTTTSPTWAEATASFMQEGKKRLKPRTQRDYSRLIARHFRFGELKLSEIKPAEIQRHIDKLSETPVEQHHAFVVLRTFFRWAHRKHFIETNPMERMASGYRYRSRSRILTDAELAKVWKATGDDTFGIIVRLLILTGQRTGEIKSLTRKMIGQDTVTFPDTKNGKPHTFPITKQTHKLLAHVPFGTLPNFARAKAALDKRSGVTGWTLHDLRRTFASGLASLGVPLPVIEKLLNHVSGSFAGIVGVYQRYSFEKEMREAVEKWGDHLQTLIA